MGRSRHRAREFALQGLYQWLLSANDASAIEAHIAQVSGFDKADADLFRALLRGTVKDADELRDQVRPHLDRELSRLSPVEHAILLLAAYELKHRIETPYRVILNEAVELAKQYGGTDGHKYINGVLDKLAAQLRPGEARERQPAPG